MNTKFEIIPTRLKDAVLIRPFSVDDLRGNFTKDFLSTFYEEQGLETELSETFYATNVRPNILRGMHFALRNPQAKIVRCLSGEIYDVIIDIRRSSPTYLKWEGFYLGESNNCSLYVPRGFAHGYLVIRPGITSYKCCGKYDPSSDAGVIFDDPTFGIVWPIGDKERIITSNKDGQLPKYNDLKKEIEY